MYTSHIQESDPAVQNNKTTSEHPHRQNINLFSQG